MRYGLAALLMAAVVALVGACSKESASPASGPANGPASVSSGDMKDVLDQVCTKCHSLKRVENYKGADDWRTIVERMTGVHGAKLEPAQAPGLVAYLDKTYPKK